MQPRHLLGEAQGVFSTHLQRVKHEPAAHVRIVRVVGEVRHTFRVLLWLEITSRTFRRTSQLLRKNTKQKYEGTTPARGDLATKLALLTPQLKRKHDSPLQCHSENRLSLVRAKTLCTAQLQRGAPNFSRSAPRCDINRFASLWASSQPLRYRSTKASVAYQAITKNSGNKMVVFYHRRIIMTNQKLSKADFMAKVKLSQPPVYRLKHLNVFSPPSLRAVPLLWHVKSGNTVWCLLLGSLNSINSLRVSWPVPGFSKGSVYIINLYLCEKKVHWNEKNLPQSHCSHSNPTPFQAIKQKTDPQEAELNMTLVQRQRTISGQPCSISSTELWWLGKE